MKNPRKAVKKASLVPEGADEKENPLLTALKHKWQQKILAEIRANKNFVPHIDTRSYLKKNYPELQSDIKEAANKMNKEIVLKDFIFEMIDYALINVRTAPGSDVAASMGGRKPGIEFYDGNFS